ncbi:MAG: hypothetical protein OEZ06_13710 [Myxococcales bacterium]|nr:hypothetical protein [Myxococcales bacterium]
MNMTRASETAKWHRASLPGVGIVAMIVSDRRSKAKREAVPGLKAPQLGGFGGNSATLRRFDEARLRLRQRSGPLHLLSLDKLRYFQAGHRPAADVGLILPQRRGSGGSGAPPRRRELARLRLRHRSGPLHLLSLDTLRHVQAGRRFTHRSANVGNTRGSRTQSAAARPSVRG